MQATATSERLTAGFPTSLSAGKRGRPKKLVGEGFLRWSSAAPAVAQSIRPYRLPGPERTPRQSDERLDVETKIMRYTIPPIWLAVALITGAGNAQIGDKPFPGHHVIGNVYYVGSTNYASYLITSPAGNILINSSYESTVPWIRANIEKLGFRFEDTRILLTSHAHRDHVAGNALVERLTGAKAMVMAQDADLVRSGGKGEFHYGDAAQFPPSRVDRVLRDGDQVRLGGVVLTAHLTPGHTKGCTTWTLQATENGKIYDVVIVGSPNTSGYKLVGNPKYPQIADEFVHTFDVLTSLHCDVFLGAHGEYYNMQAKFARLRAGAAPNPFIDPEGYRAFVASKEAAFRKELDRQRAMAAAR